MNDSKNKFFMMIIALLLIATSYMTTAFFIGVWPFEKNTLDTIPQETLQFLDGLGEEDYRISNGERLMFEDFSIIYPEGFLMMGIGESDSVVGVDSINPNVSVSVSKIDFGETDSTDIADLLSDRIDFWYKTAKKERVEFLGRECTIFSGVIEKIGRTDSMVVLVVPNGNINFLLTGVFDNDKKSQEKIEKIFETFRLIES